MQFFSDTNLFYPETKCTKNCHTCGLPETATVLYSFPQSSSTGTVSVYSQLFGNLMILVKEGKHGV